MKYAVKYPSGHSFSLCGELKVVPIAGRIVPCIDLSENGVVAAQNVPAGAVAVLDPRAVIVDENGVEQYRGRSRLR